MRMSSTTAVALSAALIACGGPATDGGAGNETAGVPEDAAADQHASADPSMIESWKQELLQADEQFSATIANEGLSRWGSFFTDDGAMVREGVGEIRGAEAVQAAMDEGAGVVIDFRWYPERAEVSSSGDLGYTVGRSRILLMGPDDVEMVTTGMYVSIWRRQANGEWKVEMDLGNPLTQPTPVPEDETGTGVPLP